MRRSNRNREEEPNHDSFLDIVANLVGILIILVMVVGVRAKEAIVDAAVSAAEIVEPSSTNGLQNRREALAEAEADAAHIEEDVHSIENRLDESSAMLDARREQREMLLTAVAAVELELEARRSATTDGEQADVGLLSQLATNRSLLEQLRIDRNVVQSSVHSPTIIKHLPTPLARTVFGSEEHFRLLGGRLVYIPMNELVEMLKADAPTNVSRLRDVSHLTETIGPIGDFRLRYTLLRQQEVVNGPTGPVQREMVGLLGFELVANHDRLGEPLDMALTTGSDFEKRLSLWDPDLVTITVWTYPDSFGEFRRLKGELAQRGFLTAARALPEGEPISGSPQGSRSSGQ